MRILISLPYFPLPGTGTGNAVYGISKSLIKAGANITVLAESDEYEKSIYKGVPHINFAKQKYKNPFTISNELKKYLKTNEKKIDLLILNGAFVPYIYSLAMFAKKLKIPYIHVPHNEYNDISFEKSPIRKIIYFKLFEQKVIQNSLAVQMFSDSQIKDTRKKIFFKHGIIVPNGIDLELINNIQNNKKKINDKIHIIYFGRKAVFTKGLDLLVKAVSQMNQKNFEVDIVGSNTSDTYKIVNLISNLHIENINIKDKYLGNPIELLQNYDFMIIPSRIEPFCIAALEAMLAELPIIISEEAGIADYILKAKAGLVCKPNIESIKSTLEEMLRKKNEWKTMGNNAQNYVIENLTWDTIGIEALKIYTHLCNENKNI